MIDQYKQGSLNLWPCLFNKKLFVLPLTKISLYQILLSVVAGCTFTPRANVCGRKPGQTVKDKFVVVMVTEQACEPYKQYTYQNQCTL